MTYEEFWEKPPILVKYYREAHNLKRQELNQQMWVQGLYIRKAIISSFGNETKYPEKPFDLFKKAEEQSNVSQEVALERAIEQLNSWKKAFSRSKNNGR